MVFIPYSDPIEIAKILDYKRLGKQRVEARQILSIITGEAKWTAWRNHPAVLMWKPYISELKYYYDIMVLEWVKRGYVNHMPLYGIGKIEMPWFMYCKPILDSHKATLLRKNHDHYKQFFSVSQKYLSRNVIWPIIGEKYLNEDQIEKLKELVKHPHKKIKLEEYTQAKTITQDI